MKMVTIELPEYAVRYLRQLCVYDREILMEVLDTNGSSIQLDARFDALNAIECALPPK